MDDLIIAKRKCKGLGRRWEQAGFNVSFNANEQGVVLGARAQQAAESLVDWRSGTAASSQVKGNAKASKSVYLRDIRIRIFGRAFLVCIHRQVARAVPHSCVRVGIVIVGAGSRQIRALVLDDLLKYIVQNRLRVVRVLYVLRDS